EENQFGLVTPSIVETSFNLAIHQRPIIAHGDLVTIQANDRAISVASTLDELKESSTIQPQ
ncbi:hypothetical protein, partial [Rubinisphaera sp.]|uniref:hypothetical protein n=1 Tax=Rubinisphaera sp. TaxID=2024857 RepID=UPI0025FD7FF3